MPPYQAPNLGPTRGVTYYETGWLKNVLFFGFLNFRSLGSPAQTKTRGRTAGHHISRGESHIAADHGSIEKLHYAGAES